MKYTREIFIQKAKEVHGDRYGYDNVVYNRSSIPVVIVCKEHGKFTQRPNDHLRGRGCPSCGGSSKITTDEFVRRAKLVHGDAYSYTNTVYTNMDSKVLIECSVHGAFYQLASSHLRGVGCSKCSTTRGANKIRLTTNDFVQKARLVHGDVYDYSLVDYTSAHDKVSIVCPRHGTFWQIANDHLQGNGCPICKGSVSKKERLWLDAMGIPNDDIHRQVLLPLPECRVIVDGFVPETNTVYEFLGDYWHGNPRKYTSGINPTNGVEYSVLFEKTMDRLDLLKKLGYNVVYVWESDWSPITHKEKKYVEAKQNRQPTYC